VIDSQSLHLATAHLLFGLSADGALVSLIDGHLDVTVQVDAKISLKLIVPISV